MNKEMTTAQNELYRQTIKYLDIIVLAQQTVHLLKTDDLFRSIVAECIGIVNYFETTYKIANGNFDRYSQAYYAICNKQLMFDDDAKLYKNAVDLKDKVNYLNTYLINKIGMNFDDLENSFKTHSSVEQSPEINVDPTPQHTSRFSHPMSDEEVLQKSGYTMHDVADQLINTQASILLQRNIAKGKVFIYKSKPTIIPIIKIFTFVLLVALMAMTIASYTVLMLPQTTLYYASSSQADVEAQKIKFINPFPYTMILTVVFISLVAASVIKNMNNDNAKFFMPWGWLSFFTAFILIVIISSNESQIILFNRLGNFELVFKHWENVDSQNNWTPAALEAIKMIDLWKIFQYVIYGILGLIVVCIVTAVIFNPKKDIDRIKQLLEQYANEIRNGEIDTSGFGSSPFGGISTRMF